jgi:ferredoxin--NADP+ reductase
MNKIVDKEYFSENVVRLEVEAPLIAKARKAGNFVIVRTGEKGERIPLTIASADTQKGTITLVVQKIGVSSTKLANLNVGDEITDVVGPLGKPTDIRKYGTVVCAGGGVGVAPLLPIVEAMKQAGNKVVVVLAARTKDLIIMEKQMKALADEVIIMTDDGSYGEKGLVTNGVRKSDTKGESRLMCNHRSCYHDEICFPINKKIQFTNNGIFEHDHGRRYRNVRSLPYYCWR